MGELGVGRRYGIAIGLEVRPAERQQHPALGRGDPQRDFQVPVRSRRTMARRGSAERNQRAADAKDVAVAQAPSADNLAIADPRPVRREPVVYHEPVAAGPIELGVQARRPLIPLERDVVLGLRPIVRRLPVAGSCITRCSPSPVRNTRYGIPARLAACRSVRSAAEDR